MSNETRTESARTVDGRLRRWLSGPRLDALVATLAVLMMAGIAWDFRSHAQGISFAEEGFLTPSHAFFYSMFVGIAVVVGAATYRNRLAGAAWVDAAPTGYGWGVVGVLAFAGGGVVDFGWHSAFGFETGVEALTSPSHLLLATGGALFLASPLRAAWRRDGNPTGVALVPALVSASLVLTTLALFTTYVNPLVNVYADSGGEMSRTLGVPAFIVFPALLVGTALALVRRFDLPAGALALVFALPALASVAIHGQVAFVLPALSAGLVGDALVRWRRPTPDNPRALRAFAAAVPASFGAAYFAVVAATTGIGWSVHVWTGAVVLAAFAGLLLSFVVLPDATGVPDGAETGGP